MQTSQFHGIGDIMEVCAQECTHVRGSWNDSNVGRCPAALQVIADDGPGSWEALTDTTHRPVKPLQAKFRHKEVS